MTERIRGPQALAIIVLLLAMFGPVLTVGGFSTRPELVFGLLIMFYLVTKSNHVLHRPYLDGVNKWFVFLGISFLASMVYAAIFLGVKVGPRDLLEFVRLIYYFFLYTILVNNNDERGLRLGLKILLAGMLGIILVSFLQYSDIGHINKWFTSMYTDQYQLAGLQGEIRRIVGTVGNPNHYAFVLSVIIIVLFSNIFTADCTLKLKGLLFGTMILALAALILTFSRTGIVMTVGGIVYVLIVSICYQKISRKNLLLLLGLVAVVAVLLAFGPEGFIWRMQNGLHFATSHGYTGRVAMWSGAWEKMKTSPIFGWGPAKESMPTFTDNEYVLITRRYGIIGLICYLGLYFSFWRQFKPGKWIKSSWFPFAIASNAIIPMLLVYSVTSGSFYNIQISSLLIVLMSSLLAQKREI